jgi:hypothetical protein
MKHLHHITPKHIGGTDEPNNLIEVSLTQHTMWHYANWRLWGRLEDHVAYRGLGGQVQGEELSLEKRRLGQLRGGQTSTPKKAEAARRNQKLAAARVKELKTGVWALTKEQSSMACKGKKWITDGIKSKRILPSTPLPEGWRYGRSTPWRQT